MSDNDRALCAAAASFLRAAALLAHWGFMLTCTSALVLALALCPLSSMATMGFSAVVLLGTVERYLALRLRFDTALFANLACSSVASLDALDKALCVLGLRPQRPLESARSLTDRVHGTRQLLQRHVIVVACQSTVFFSTSIIQRLW